MADLDRIIHIGFPNETGYTDITTGIEAGSVSINEVLSSTEDLRFNQINYNKMEATIYGCPDVSGQLVQVWYTTSTSSTPVYLFTGYVDSCEANGGRYVDSTYNGGDYRKIVAYDSTYKFANKDATLVLKSFFESTTTTKTASALLSHILRCMGINSVYGNTYNNNYLTLATCINRGYFTDYNITYTIGTSMTYSQVIAQLCEIFCALPTMSRDGTSLHLTKLGYITYPSFRTRLIDASTNIEQDSIKLEKYSIDTCKVCILDLEGNSLYAQTVTPDTNNVYYISGNNFIQNFSSTNLETLATETANIISYLNNMPTVLSVTIGTNIHPATINLIQSDLDNNDVCQLGDIVKINDNNYTLALEISYSGPLLVEETISSSYNQTISTDQSSIDPITQAVINSTQTLAANAVTDRTTNKNRIESLILLNDAIQNGMMLHQTTISGQVYYHDVDDNDLDNSNFICTINSGGFAFTDDWNGGSPVWDGGLNFLNNTFMTEKLTAISISADMITTGVIKANNGNTTLDMDNGVFSVTNASDNNLTTLISPTDGVILSNPVKIRNPNISASMSNALRVGRAGSTDSYSLFVNSASSSEDIIIGDENNSNLSAYVARAGKLYTGRIDCGDVDCLDISCGDVDCGDVDCGDISCSSITINKSSLADFVIEQGTSGGWTYRKWNSGKLEQWKNISFVTPTVGSWTSWNNMYYCYTDVTFGKAFADGTYPIIQACTTQHYVSSSQPGGGIALNTSVARLTSSGCRAVLLRPAEVNDVFYISIYAVGTYS